MRNDKRPPVRQMPANQLGFEHPPDNRDIVGPQPHGGPAFQPRTDDFFPMDRDNPTHQEQIAPPMNGSPMPHHDPRIREDDEPLPGGLAQSGPISLSGLGQEAPAKAAPAPAPANPAAPDKPAPQKILGVPLTPITVGAALLGGYLLVRHFGPRGD